MNDSRPQDSRLERSLGLGSVVLTGVAYMAPMIVLGTFGVVAQASNGTVPTAYVVTLIAMLFTAYSYGRMAAAYPVSGSAYTYVGKGIGPKFGFLGAVAVSCGTALRPKIVSAKARGAGRSHSAVKPCNAGWRDFGPQPEGPAAIFPQSGVAARSCSWATLCSLRLVLRKNSRRRGVA